MRLLFAANVFGWRMTGLMGAGAAWFLGFSKRPPEPTSANGPYPRPRKGVDACDCKGIVGDNGRCDGACERSARPQDGPGRPARSPLPDNVVPGPWKGKAGTESVPKLHRAAERIIRIRPWVRLRE